MSVVSVETEEGIAETGVEVVSHPVRDSLESLGLPIPSSTSWPDYPVLLTQSDGPKSHDRVVQKCASSIPIESSLFRGQTFLYVDDGTLPCKGGKRRSTFTLRGQFKRRVCFGDLLIGHEFGEISQPPATVRMIILGFLNKFFPHLKINLSSKHTSALAPVLLECKRLRVAEASSSSSTPKQQAVEERESPCDESGVFNIEEDTALLGGYFAERRRSWKQRMSFFRRKENLGNFWFEPGLEYTFEFYQNNLSFTDYKLRFGFISVGIAKIIKGQPVQFLIKQASTGEYLCYFQFWSSKLLQYLVT